MKRPGAVLLAALLAATCAAAQDTATLGGEPAIRFLAGHGHLLNYCEGQLTVTRTRVRFDGLSTPRHSFDVPRAQVTAKHARFFGAHYIKLRAAGKTYRMPLYPDVARRLGDRFALFLRALRDFDAAHAEIRRAETMRVAEGVTLSEEGGEPVLRAPVLVGYNVLWFRGPGGVTVWQGPEADARAYERIAGGAVSPATLEIGRERVRLVSAEGGVIAEAARGELRVRSAVAGYPRLVLAFRATGRVSLVTGELVEGKLTVRDANALTRALGTEFEQVAAEVRRAPAEELR